ncbi:YraN family protein [Thermoanaerobacterium sp. DL9XJH110]|jgi:putative endonuclease|uniref:YraN family protein n=1 Tax=Thermoanaerobacterium sp. DL9XJH110 TaxID=3386643 RepID=UPI003BB8080A
MGNKILGSLGEQLATEFLKRLNYRILATNYRCRFGELDIIALDGGTIVFVEVKTRSTQNFGKGMEAVNYYKQQKIKKTALAYLNESKHPFKNLRFDVIDILINREKTPEITHIVNAF